MVSTKTKACLGGIAALPSQFSDTAALNKLGLRGMTKYDWSKSNMIDATLGAR
jgi:hypothetical protein